MKLRIAVIVSSLLIVINIKLGLSQPVVVNLPTEATGELGDFVTVPIEVGSLTDRNVFSFQTTVVFDESVLDAVAASTDGTLAEQFGPPTVNTNKADTIIVVSFGISALSGEGILVNLIFRVVGQVGEISPLRFVNFLFNEGDPPVQTQNGRFTVIPTVSVNDLALLPQTFALRQNYPNPFNPETAITFDVPAAWPAQVTLRILTVQGQLVRTLVNGNITSGTHTIVWNGKDDMGEPVFSGLYFYQISSGSFVALRKMLLIR